MFQQFVYFVMAQFSSPQDDSAYVSNTNSYILTDKPYVAAEFNVDGQAPEATVTERSKSIGAVIASVGDPSRAAGIGNGIALGKGSGESSRPIAEKSP